MKKILSFIFAIGIVFMISFCERKEEHKNILPQGREVTLVWVDTIGTQLFGLMTFVETGEVRKVIAEWNKENNTFRINNSKGEPALQQQCRCTSCTNSWCPNPNIQWGCCIPCPNCQRGATSAYCYWCGDEGGGYCWFFWVD